MAAAKKKAESGKRLATYVHVDGAVYGPDDEVPAEVAEQITNPKAWASEDAEQESDSSGDDA